MFVTIQVCSLLSDNMQNGAKLNFCLFFHMRVKLALSHWGNIKSWGCFISWCWGWYLGRRRWKLHDTVESWV